MNCDTYQSQPGPPRNVDDEISALAFQLEEIESHSASQKGKHRVLIIDYPCSLFYIYMCIYLRLHEV
jgi:hypothetical protein